MNQTNKLFEQQVQVINLGIASFSEDLKKQNVPVVHVDWNPPAGGNKKVASLLDKLKS